MASYTYEFVELGDDEHRLGCKCCRFKKGYDLPIPKSLTEEEIQTLATGLSTSVIKNWTTLNAIVKRFEETIQKRWLKKNDQKRRQILLKAWPDMSPTHRPDFANFRKPGKNEPRSRTRPSAAYLWPHINLEDLQQKSLLLIFINSRARNFPTLLPTSTTAKHMLAKDGVTRFPKQRRHPCNSMVSTRHVCMGKSWTTHPTTKLCVTCV